jgi:hypothetical protein
MVQRIQRNALKRLVRQTVEAELDKLPAHVDQAAETA